MAEVIREYSAVTDAAGEAYTARVYGARNEDGMWEAWIGFTPGRGGGREMRTGRETEQSDREDLAYWASGLTERYLEGALDRARERERG